MVRNEISINLILSLFIVCPTWPSTDDWKSGICRLWCRFPLMPVYRKVRLQWCWPPSTWNSAHLGCIILSDGYRFQLFSDDNYRHVWRHTGRSGVPVPACDYHTPHRSQQGVMVWGVIFFDCDSSFVVISGTLTAQRYFIDILRLVVLQSFLCGTQDLFFNTIMTAVYCTCCYELSSSLSYTSLIGMILLFPFGSHLLFRNCFINIFSNSKVFRKRNYMESV